jgi:putative chitinase
MGNKMLLTEDQVKQIIPLNKKYKEWTSIFNEILPKYDINTKARMVMFFAQCNHESNQFTVLKENLNYSQQALTTIFKKYFSIATAVDYARKPEKIANRVYANRMGNGDEKSGDGYKYRGRGAIQLTGKINYSAFAKYIGKTLEETVKYCETNAGALESACFFWNQNQLNAFADVEDIEGATKRINGGVHGLLERIQNYNVISTVIPE